MLSSWDDAQVLALGELEHATPDVSVLSGVIESACLHELTRLAGSQPTLVDYVRTVMDLFSQLTPAGTARLAVAMNGLPPIEASYGALSRGESVDDRVQFMLDIGPGIAVLEIGRLTVFKGSTLFERLAKEVNGALGALVSVEADRRAGASVRIADLLASARDWREEDWLRSVVSSLALLPGARGARVSIAGIGVGATFAATAGGISGAAAYERVQTVPGGTVVNVALYGGDDPIATTEADELISAVATMEAERHERASGTIDPVTGLPDRAMALDGIGAAIRWSERRSLPCAVVVLTADEPLDDEMRIRAMNALRGELAREMLCHTSAQRFVTVLHGHDRSDGRRAADRLRDTAARGVLKRHIAPRPRTFSAGVAIYPDAGGIPAMVLAAAESSLEEASQLGGDRSVVGSTPPKRWVS